MSAPVHVVATAGHVDHGKSSLIVRLTGIDPDRWEEEKRRGLTIDLGFAWTTLPSGREVGFVDVPGHERFVANMLAGVGPVRLVLFVVAADEGWKPQSEEHLAIVDVLGAEAGVVALTKADLADEQMLAARREDVETRLSGTALSGAPIVACSSATGEGIEDLRAALDALVAGAPPPEDAGRPRIHVDRSFTIKGAGTVVTGTLTGGRLAVGREAEVYPSGLRARIRGLQTHRRPVEEALPVARVAANLAATAREEVARGDVLGLPGQWRPTSLLEVQVRPLRGAPPLRGRGAHKLHVGSAERDAQVRLYGVREVAPGESAFARLRLNGPVTVAVGDRFVLRDTGRRATVAGGVVLDTEPPSRPGPRPEERLGRRVGIGPGDLPGVIVAERGAVRASDLEPLVGTSPSAIPGAVRLGPWWIEEASLQALAGALTGALAEHHRRNPLAPGMPARDTDALMVEARPALRAAIEPGLGAAIVEHLEAERILARDGTVLRLPEHRVSLGEHEEEAERLIERVRGAEPTPPGVKELLAEGYPRELIEAAVATGRLVRISDDLVVSAEMASRAEQTARAQAASGDGLTVSRFRELLGTTRKYALPLLEYLDRTGVTRREGDVRRLR